MRNQLLPKAIVATILLTLLFSIAKAQSPGIIVRPAGGPYSSVLDPNQNGFTSSATTGFTTNDITQSEIPYVVVPPAITEPTGDLATGPSGGFTDIVKTVDNSGFYIYSNGTNLYFRLRIGGIISGSKGYSILIDTDGKMGNSGPYADTNYVAPTNTSNGNPGFEYEVVFETNFQVAVFNVDGKSNPGAPSTYPLSSNSQISVALSTDGNNPDYFYDWYVPLSSIGSPSSIRMAATTVTSPNSALQGSRSDIYGIDDANSTVANAWQSVVNAQPFISITGSGISSVGVTCTAAPSVNSPITTGSSVSVSGSWTRMDASKPSSATISLYKITSGVTTLVNTTTVNTGNTWSITVPTVISGDIFYAKAVAAGESECLQSNSVRAGCNNQTTLTGVSVTCSSDRGFDGQAPAGYVVKIYTVTSSGYTLFADETTTTYKVSHPSSGRWVYDGPNTNSTNPCTGGATDVPNGSYAITVTAAGQCESDYVYACVGLVTTATPSITAATVYSNMSVISGTAANNSTVRLYVNNKLIATAAASASGIYSFSGLTLNTTDVVDVYAQSTGLCMSSKVSRTVNCYTAFPFIITNSSGNLLSGATVINGTSAYPGATITLYKGTSPSGVSQGVAMVNASGAWNITVPALITGNSYYATQTYNGCTSISSSSALVATATTVCASFGSTSYASTATTISGTLDASFSGVVKLYLDGVQIGVTATLSAATTWSINSPFTYSLYPGGTLTVTAQSTGAAEKPGCNSASISCTSPTSPSASPTSSTINTGGTVTYTVADVVANTWYAIMDNSGASYATSQYSSSTSNLSFTTSAFGTPGTYNLKISADQLSGCAPSYIAATVLVNSTVLPVRFVSTTAKKINSQVMVEWSVADEMDVRNYVVERSYDCINFEAVATVNYHAPASVTNKYSFTDNGQGSNKICYRIKQLDVNGNYLYSSIVSVAGTVPKAQVQPNPFLQSIAVNTFLPSAQPIKIQLLDMSGRLIRYKSVPGVSGANKIEFDDLGGLQPGMYMVRIITIDSITERKLIKANP